MRRQLATLLGMVLVAFAAFWFISRPLILPIEDYRDLVGDLSNGEQIFWAGGCASCHADQHH